LNNPDAQLQQLKGEGLSISYCLNLAKSTVEFLKEIGKTEKNIGPLLHCGGT